MEDQPGAGKGDGGEITVPLEPVGPLVHNGPTVVNLVACWFWVLDSLSLSSVSL